MQGLSESSSRVTQGKHSGLPTPQAGESLGTPRSLTSLPTSLSQPGCSRGNGRETQLYVPGYRAAVTKANAAFPRGYSGKTSSTASVLQNRSFPHPPSFCSQPSSSLRSAPCPPTGFSGMPCLARNKTFSDPRKAQGYHASARNPRYLGWQEEAAAGDRGAVSELSVSGLCSHRSDSGSSFSSKVQAHLQEASNPELEVHEEPPDSFPRSSSGSQGVSSRDPALRRRFCHSPLTSLSGSTLPAVTSSEGCVCPPDPPAPLALIQPLA